MIDQSLRFWENWEPAIRKSFKFFGVVLLVLIVALIVAAWRTPAPTVTWAFYQEREILEKVVHQFQTGPFSLQTTGDNILLQERLVGNEFVFQIWPTYLFLAVIIIGLTILVSVLSTFSRFWFFIGSGILIFLLSGLQLELLNVLGQENQGPAIFLIALIIGTGLAYQYYFQSATLPNRLLVFGSVIIGSFTLLTLLARVPNPVYLLAVGFVPSAVAGSALLAIVVGHEIVATLVHMITRGLKGSNSLPHFAFLTVIYLANLVATYLNDQSYLRWDYSLNPVLLLLASAVLAIWGIRRQQEQMDGFLLDGSAGPIAIVGLAIIAGGASAFFYTTGNDAAIETIRNISLYSHISYGIIFLLYIISNFGGLLKENYPVGRVLFKPKSMPFFTYRLAGSITLTGFILYNFWQRPLNDTRGARDAAMGDYYVATDNLKMAEGFFKRSDDHAFHNHHANYALANIEGARGNILKERQYFLDAAERRPTQQAYMSAINTLDRNPIKMYAYLQGVIKDFPYSGAANNALGLVYSQLNQPDSAIIFFNLAKKDKITSATAELNLLATAIKHNLILDADSVYETLDSEAQGPLANTFALANKSNSYLNQTIALPGDSLLDLFSSSLINNYLLNHIDSLDTAFISGAEKLARLRSNSDYFETILGPCALAYYQSGLVNRAFRVMQEATVYSDEQGKKNNTMALWALEQSAPGVALGYSLYAANQGYDGGLLTQAIALAESGRSGEAVVLFDSIRRYSKDLAVLAESLQRILAVDKKRVKELNDLEKYSYCRYRLSFSDSAEFTIVSNSIDDPNWKARAIFDRSKKLYDWDEQNSAIQVHNRLNGIAISDRKLFNDIQIHELMLAAVNGNAELINTKLPTVSWPGFRRSEKLYLEGLVAFSTGDSLKLKRNLNMIASNNSFFPEGVVTSAILAKRGSQDALASYNILANALHINSQSIRILKAFIQEARVLGFDDYATDAEMTLRLIYPEPLFARFMRSLQ